VFVPSSIFRNVQKFPFDDEKKKAYESQKKEDELKKKMKLMRGFNIGPWVVICILLFLLVAIVIMK
jgi:flagellar biosynthesis/type III secretory pathway M-ring protein FliF/YscJ